MTSPQHEQPGESAPVILTLLAGKSAPFGPPGHFSAIDKQAVSGRVRVAEGGLVCDQQGDPIHHGGAEKAIHHYALEHYQAWAREDPQLQHALINPGAFGENFSTCGLTEETVCIGDIYRAGTALIQVSQPRKPCWKLNRRFGDNTMAKRVQESLRTGWYYRVLEEGEVAAGDVMLLVDRLRPDWTLERLLRSFFRTTLDYAALEAIAELPELSESWRQTAITRIGQRKVESWHKRLSGPDAALPE